MPYDALINITFANQEKSVYKIEKGKNQREVEQSHTHTHIINSEHTKTFTDADCEAEIAFRANTPT